MKNKIKLKPIDEQVIVITGASSGIGLATAQLAAKMGAKVVLASRNEEALQKITAEINHSGGDAIYVRTDVSNYDEVVHLKDRAIEKFMRFDTWINNAGVSVYGNVMDIPLEDEKKVFETNFWGVRHGCRVAVPLLEIRGGALINLGSEVSSVSIPLQGIYSATKHAVKAYTDALRLELEKQEKPVSVTLVRPAAINTPYAKHAKNLLRSGAPSLPAPLYNVEIAAKAILKCAENPTRDAYIGFASRAFTVMETIAPQLTDLIIKKSFFAPQAAKDESEHLTRDETLHHHPPKEGETTDHYDAKVSDSSLYTKLTVGQKEESDTSKRQ